MYKLLIIFYIPIALANNLPGSNVLSGDQVVPTFNKEKKNSFIPEDQVIGNIQNPNLETTLNDMGIKDNELRKNIIKSQQYFQNLQSGNFQPPTVEDEVKVIQSAPMKVPTSVKSKPVVTLKPKLKKKAKKKRTSIQIYVSNQVNYYEIPETITLPSAALTPATLMAGVEVSTEKKLVDVEIDYAFVGPNGAVVDMTDCHTWIEVWGNYNTERIYGKTKSISCRAPNGQTFEIPITGQLRDSDDEYIGIKAELLTKGKVKAAALEFLQNGTNMFGKAIAAAQVSTEVVSGNVNSTAQKGQNVTGDQSKFIMGQSIAGATGGFLQWWVDYYKNLSPTLAIAPGTKVFLSVKGEVQIPKAFFQDSETNESYSRLNTNKTLTIAEEEK